MYVLIIICMYIHVVQRIVVKPRDVCIWHENVKLTIVGQTKNSFGLWHL